MDLNLDGHEISVIKAIGIRGGELSGEELIGKVPEMMPAELIDVLKGLIMQGFVECDRRSVYSEDDLKQAHYNVNSGYARDLKEALDPQPKQRSKRVRRE